MLVSSIIYGNIWTNSVFYARSIILRAMKSFVLSALGHSLRHANYASCYDDTLNADMYVNAK